MTAALRLLAETPGRRRIAVLGTMKELGEQSVALHRRVGAVVQKLRLDHLFTLAEPEEADALADGATDVPSHIFREHDALAEQLASELRPGDRVLFKASRSVELDKVVKKLEDVLGRPGVEASTVSWNS